MLEVHENLYNGLIIEKKSISQDRAIFLEELKTLLRSAKENNKSLVWLELTRQEHEHISVALLLGFEFHNCESTILTLIYRVNKDAYVPVAPTHTIGVGAVVINDKDEILLVRDRIHTLSSIYKLPGGMLEEAQRLEEGVVREVWEETGIESKLIKMVSLLNSHPYRFNKSNLYIVFQLKALTQQINVIDRDEIEKALWMPLEEFFAHNEMSDFQKELVKVTLEHEGLSPFPNKIYFPKKKYVEVYS